LHFCHSELRNIYVSSPVRGVYLRLILAHCIAQYCNHSVTLVICMQRRFVVSSLFKCNKTRTDQTAVELSASQQTATNFQQPSVFTISPLSTGLFTLMTNECKQYSVQKHDVACLQNVGSTASGYEMRPPTSFLMTTPRLRDTGMVASIPRPLRCLSNDAAETGRSSATLPVTERRWLQPQQPPATTSRT